MDHAKEFQAKIGLSIDVLASDIASSIKDLSLEVEIQCRVKQEETIVKKLILKKSESVFDVKDVYGIRIITKNVDGVYAIVEQIVTKLPSYLKRDLIKNPYYLGTDKNICLRMCQIIGIRNNCNYEVQVTTQAFHAMNESQHEQYHRRKYGSLF